jgi:hypothetical protein
MNYLNLKNPSDKEVNTIFKGEAFVMKPGSTEKFPEDLVTHLINIYQFLEVGTETKEVVKELVKEVEEKVAEVTKTKAKAKK